MTDTTQWPTYGAWCSRCERGIHYKLPPGRGSPIWVRCRECDRATPAYRNLDADAVRTNRENGNRNNSNV